MKISVDTATRVKTIWQVRTLRRIWFSRLPAGGSKWVEEQNRLNDPLALRYSLRGLLPIVWWGDIRVDSDGSLIAGIYPGYLDGQKNFPWAICMVSLRSS